MKRALAALFPLLWGCAADEAPLAGTAVDPDVLFEHSTFADAALERVIREVLDRPRGTLSETELGSVETLDAGRPARSRGRRPLYRGRSLVYRRRGAGRGAAQPRPLSASSGPSTRTQPRYESEAPTASPWAT